MSRSLIVLAVLILWVGTACERASTSTGRRLVQHRRDLVDVTSPVPARGIVSGLYGVNGAEERVIVDLDAATVTRRTVGNLLDPDMVPVEVKGPLDAAEARRLWQLAEAAWASPPPTKFDDVSDYGGLLIAADGDDVWILRTPGPMHASPAKALEDAVRHVAGYAP